MVEIIHNYQIQSCKRLSEKMLYTYESQGLPSFLGSVARLSSGLQVAV